MITKIFVGLKQQLIVIKSNHWNCQIIADKIFNVFNVKGEIKQIQGIDYYCSAKFKHTRTI